MKSIMVHLDDDLKTALSFEIARRIGASPLKRVTISDVVREALETMPWAQAHRLRIKTLIRDEAQRQIDEAARLNAEAEAEKPPEPPKITRGSTF